MSAFSAKRRYHGKRWPELRPRGKTEEAADRAKARRTQRRLHARSPRAVREYGA